MERASGLYCSNGYCGAPPFVGTMALPMAPKPKLLLLVVVCYWLGDWAEMADEPSVLGGLN